MRLKYLCLSILSVGLLACSTSEDIVTSGRSQSSVQNTIDKIVATLPDRMSKEMASSISSLPKEDQEYIALKRKANMALAPYVTLEKRQYRLNISQQEAEQKLNVPQWLYEKICQEVEDANNLIAEKDANKEKVSLMNPQGRDTSKTDK